MGRQRQRIILVLHEDTEMKRKETGNQDQKELNRTLSEAEQKRLDQFEARAGELIRQGYRRVNLTVSIVSANIFAVVLLIPVMALGFWLFWLKNGTLAGGISSGGVGGLLLFLVVMLVLVAVHELIHGLSWSLFTEHRFGDIEFGFMKQYLTPYCTCLVPLSRGQYIFGALMPLIVLGILPMIVGILTGSMPVLFMGIIMTVSAAGDIMIVWRLLTYRSQAETVVYIDHPTQAGGVIFEK